MNISERLQKAAEILTIPETTLQEVLTSKIGVSNEDLNDEYVFRFADFNEALKPIPIAKARKAYRLLRTGKLSGDESKNSRSEELKALGVKTTISTVGVLSLIKIYDPTKVNDPVTEELRRRFGDTPVIAFNDNNEVDIETTSNVLDDLAQGLPTGETAIRDDGSAVRLQKIGVIPFLLFDEDPLFPGKPLKRNRSTVNNRNWSHVDQQSRQFCRILAERGDINVNSVQDVIFLLTTASGGIKALGMIYPEAALEYSEKLRRNELPSLKIELGRSAKKNNPFSTNRAY